MRNFGYKVLAGLAILSGIGTSVLGQSLQTALDAPGLTWTTSGTSGGGSWFGQSTTYYFGGSAAHSGFISYPQSSILQTTVTGPGTLTFWWKVATTLSSNPGGGSMLAVKVNGITQTSLLDNADWNQQTIYLGSGSQAVQWVLSYYAFPVGTGTGWVDDVTWAPGTTAPIITGQPPGQSEVAGLDATFRVNAIGTPPLSYQWRFNGADYSGATNSTFVVTNVQSASLGNYCVVITNVAGSVTSSVAPLVLGHIAAWANFFSSEIVVPDENTNALAIGAGVRSSLILNPDRTVTAWGLYQTNMPGGLTNMIAVAGCYYHSLALRADGTVISWGYDYTGDTVVPPGLTNAVAVAGGGYHSLVLRNDGTAIAWGYNGSGQTNVPVDLTNVVAIAAGETHNLALKGDGTVVAWGSDGIGQCDVPGSLTNVVAIAAGPGQSLALRADGSVVEWGETNGFVPSNLTNAVAIAAEISCDLALKSDGTVIAWGSSFATNVPAGLSNVIAIAGGFSHALALVGDGPPVQQVAVSNATMGIDGFSLAVPSQSGRVFRLEYKNSLADPDWTALPLVAGTGTNLVLTDASEMNAQRFYRVRRW